MNTLAISNIRGAIFDMDGVLFDTEVLYERFWCEAARQFGFNMTSEHVAAIRSTDSKIAAEILKKMFGADFDYYEVRELRKKLMNDYIDLNGIRIKQGVLKTLRYLKYKKNFRIALATTSNNNRAEKYLAMSGIRDYFDALVCSDMISNGKPDPMIYETAAKEIGLKPIECIAFEDSFNGVRSAYRAGCNTYMVPDRDLPDEEMHLKTKAILNSVDMVMEEFMKDIKMAALDLDGTALKSDGTLSDVTIAAINSAVSSGIEVVVASGRSYKSLPECVKDLKGIKYAITSNGASINLITNGKRLKNYTIKSDVVLSVTERLRNISFPVEVFVDGQAYADRKYVEDPFKYVGTREVIPYVQKTRKPVDDIFEFINYNRENIDSVSIICSDTLQKEILYKEFQDEYKTQLYVTSSVAHLIEMCDINGGKGEAVRYMSGYLGIPMENVAAFGNADNDADMIKMAGFGVAVRNASEKCLEAADYVAESNDNDGVAKVLMNIVNL